MEVLTDFADQAVILPLVVASALGISLGGWKRGAVMWLLVIGATLATVGAAKLAVFVLGPPGAVPLLLSPSGHAASAPLVYGGLAWALLPGRAGRIGAVLMGAGALAAIAATRVALGEHTVPDVVVGGLLGLAGLAVLCLALGTPPEQYRGWGTAVLSGATLIGFHGLRLPAEPWLRLVARVLGGQNS